MDGYSRLAKILALALAFLLAWLTYRYVERPLRFGRKRGVVLGLCSVMAAIGITALTLEFWPGLNIRGLPSDIADLKWEGPDPTCIRELGLRDIGAGDTFFCQMSHASGPFQVAILGDSMANSLYPGMRDAYAQKGRSVINLGMGTCAPFRGLYGNFPYNRDCRKFDDFVYQYIADTPSITTVILGFASWDLLNMSFDEKRDKIDGFDQATLQTMRSIVDRDIRFLRDHNKKVIVTFDGPGNIPLHHCMMTGDCTADARSIEGPTKDSIAFWSKLLDGRSDVCVLHQTNYLRSGASYPIKYENRILYRDNHHLSDFGSHVIAADSLNSPCFKGED